MKESYYFKIFESIASLCLLFLFISHSAFGQVHSDSLWPYSKIRADVDDNDTLDYLGNEVFITGTANINSGLLHEHYLQAFVQNDSAGMSIFAMQIDTPFQVGDSLVVRGKIQRYNGLAEVSADSYQVFKNTRSRPTPKPLSAAITNPAQYLGMLVEGEGNVIEKGNTFNGKFVRISQENSQGSMMVYVSNFHHLYEDFDFDILRIGDKISVKGIITEYNPDFPNERTYKLFLRTPDDLRYASVPQYYLYLLFGGVVVGSFVIIGWVIILRHRVDSKTSEIQHSLKEKDVLLREIHHRVKNSLSIVSGLLELQLESTNNEDARSILQNSQARIHSVALIHEKLYQTESLSEIELDNYIKELVEAIHRTFNDYKKDVTLSFDLEKVELDIDRVIPCGLLINELVVNAFKHAFSKGKKGTLHFTLKTKNEHILLTVSDNGPGLPKKFDQKKDESLGTMLIHTFTAQLDGQMEIETNSRGTTFMFTFPINQKQSK
ncbi:histidine kinase dimerization/phosphoacceptor domain -containing protein [Gracilimonas sp.]|uniref:histidine kinase dimerization/phosphoacceptor domain -containing protein n=1 Tax=Gracilimonas sp. TaxID=1974203 RepID=UPI0025BC8D8A|nr:histidine kinase dimerization/phosphoacceptor domain -containing protein [Gracilimonas sp.]